MLNEGMNKEMKIAVINVGLELYDQTEVKKQEPSYRNLVTALDGRIEENIVGKAMNILSDLTLAEGPCLENKFQYSLSKEGLNFFAPIYKKMMPANDSAK